jgi:glucokinase-like ROK family protein
MTFQQTITASDMRSINQAAVLEIIRRESPISRTAIAEKLNVSLPTVMRIVDELIHENLVRPQSATEWSGGRPRALLEFNSAGQVIIGVDLGGTKMFGAVTDLGGTVIEEAYLAHHGTLGEASYARLTSLIEQLIKSPLIGGRLIRGIGIGAPGVTLHQEGIVKWAPSLNWRDFPLKAKLEQHFSLPVSVDNDVNLAALGEYSYGAGIDTQNMMLIAIGTGIGAGIIIDGALYRGANEASGEIGYLLPGRQFLNRRYEGFGALESLASGVGVAQRARQTLQGQRPAEELEQLSAEDVFEAMRRGESWAKPVIEETADYLAVAIAAASALLDPELIVLGGGVSRSADLLIDPILARIRGAIPFVPRIEPNQLGHRAAVMGAITTVLRNTNDYYVVRKLS